VNFVTFRAASSHPSYELLAASPRPVKPELRQIPSLELDHAAFLLGIAPGAVTAGHDAGLIILGDDFVLGRGGVVASDHFHAGRKRRTWSELEQDDEMIVGDNLAERAETKVHPSAIGGGIVRVRLSGKGWRTLLMEGSVFDAESPAFAPGCSAAAIIDHVAVRLHVVSDDVCDVYVPARFSAGPVHFWEVAAGSLLGHMPSSK
jgi:hypothetical protein